MINIEELRNANIIADEDDTPMYFNYAKPSKYGYRYVDSAGNSGLLKGCSGVPLTEEWLIKLGFVITRNGANLTYNEFGNIIILNRVNGKYEGSYLATPLPFVHTLQNYIYAVCNQELALKN